MAAVTDNEQNTDEEIVTSSDNVTETDRDIVTDNVAVNDNVAVIDNVAVTDNVTVTEYSIESVTNATIHTENLDQRLPHPLPSSNRKITCLFPLFFLKNRFLRVDSFLQNYHLHLIRV